MIPPFSVTHEQVVEWNHPAIVECEKKFAAISEPLASRIVSRSSTFSKDWGYVLRVVFKGAVDGQELKADQIFMCWKPASGPTGFVVSEVGEERALRDNIARTLK